MRGAKYEIEDTGDLLAICRNGRPVATVNYVLGHNGAYTVRTALANLEAVATGAQHQAEDDRQPCEGCEHLIGRHCMMSANHCLRRAEDYYDTGVDNPGEM